VKILDVKEVRIGNIASSDGYPVTIDKNDIEYLSGDREFHQYYGYPLTREILIQSGFQTWTNSNLNLDYYLEHKQYEIFQIGAQNTMLPQRDEWEIVYYREEPTVSRLHKPFHFVHQLQNLYFALYGEELNIVL
jgi:hypothetical protein